MTKVEARAVVIDRPVEDVWNFIVDISNMPRWEDSKAEWTQTSEGPVGAGTTFESSVRFLGREVRTDLRVTEFEPNHLFAVEAIAGTAKGTKISYVMLALEGGKTSLRRVTEIQLHGAAALLLPFQAPIVRWTGAMEANSVKRILEGGP